MAQKIKRNVVDESEKPDQTGPLNSASWSGKNK